MSPSSRLDAAPPHSYDLEPLEMVIMSPLLPRVMVSSMAPGPGPAVLNVLRVYRLGLLIFLKRSTHDSPIDMLASLQASDTVLAIPARPELSMPQGLATLRENAVRFRLEDDELLLVVHVIVLGEATYTATISIAKIVENSCPYRENLLCDMLTIFKTLEFLIILLAPLHSTACNATLLIPLVGCPNAIG